MSEQVIELDLEAREAPAVRRQPAVLASVLGAIVIAVMTLTVSHWQRKPPPVKLGSVVRATGMDTCSTDDRFVALTFYVVNEDPRPITLTGADFKAAPGISDASANIIPQGSGSPCGGGQ